MLVGRSRRSDGDHGILRVLVLLEDLDDEVLAVHLGEHDGGVPVALAQVGARARLQQQLEAVGLARDGGDHQGRQAHVVLHVGVGAGLQEAVDDGGRRAEEGAAVPRALGAEGLVLERAARRQERRASPDISQVDVGATSQEQLDQVDLAAAGGGR